MIFRGILYRHQTPQHQIDNKLTNPHSFLFLPTSIFSRHLLIISRSKRKKIKMGLKQALTDLNSDPKKKRRVGFSSFDVGVEANDCIKIFLVSKKEEVGVVEDKFRIEPVDLNYLFDKDGRIYGYQDLKINIFLSSISFHAYADITFQSTSDGGKGITDLKPALQKIFGESLVEKEDFLQTFSAGSHYIRNVISNGEVLHRKATKGDNNTTSNQLEAEDFTAEVLLNSHLPHHFILFLTSTCLLNNFYPHSQYQVIRMAVNSMPVGELYCSSPIDVTDPGWEMYLVVESKTDDQRDVNVKLLGFAAVYRFYKYLYCLPTRAKGHGRLLLEVLNSIALSEDVYDVTVEEASDYLQHVRTCIDMKRLLAFEPIKHAISSVGSHLRQGNFSKKTCKFQSDPPAAAVEDVRKNLKINKKQFLQCWEILIYLELDHNDTNSMDNYRTLISDRMKDDILGKDTGPNGKQIIEVPNDYDHEMTFVMYRPRDVKVDNVSVEIEGNQNNQEEQLKQLVDERMEEIIKIAKKVSLHCQ
ncbi:hypothetical protein IFM89_007461 [Coptis chinensis]|uniref:histone acetyltransferase n=1 Tax=Coptis chinensis TaxID=261450 RepID=A0A835IBA1_9MAGN|nr:hypothetical protein IFM89_007461 [Coptis chinensis]